MAAMTRNTARKAIILVVEDDPSVRTWIQQILHEHGFASVGVGDTQKALSVFDRDDVEVYLAIVDMILPGDAGLDLAAELARRHPGLRILYISGCVDSIAMEAIAWNSPELVLLKPFSEESLLERVRWLIAKPAGMQSAPAGGVTKTA
ncbi:MAG TPA: response regulator [Bryobacteraceae bacterium]|nr:response regulator [Bryobacteraceae bacterium]